MWNAYIERGCVWFGRIPGDNASSPGFVSIVEQQGAWLGKFAIVGPSIGLGNHDQRM